jgi:hypothetical protein
VIDSSLTASSIAAHLTSEGRFTAGDSNHTVAERKHCIQRRAALVEAIHELMDRELLVIGGEQGCICWRGWRRASLTKHRRFYRRQKKVWRFEGWQAKPGCKEAEKENGESKRVGAETGVGRRNANCGATETHAPFRHQDDDERVRRCR